MKKIIHVPDPRLKIRSDEVTHPSHVAGLVRDLKFLTRKAVAYGVAAPQVGVNKRVFVGVFGGGLEAIINPEIQSMSGSEIDAEGCLSIPHKSFQIERATEIVVLFTEMDGSRTFLGLEGLEARIFQHELDHLDGILISDRALAPG